MIRLTITLAALAGTLALAPAPAAAQAGQTTVVIFGNDPCPREAICIRAPESQRYRLPKGEQLIGTRQQRQSWAQKSQALTTVGRTGTGSCSAVEVFRCEAMHPCWRAWSARSNEWAEGTAVPGRGGHPCPLRAGKARRNAAGR